MAGVVLWIDEQELHPGLRTLLLRVQAAERAAVGPDRRPTFRLMRSLLGASVRLGVPSHLLAECLGTSRASVRNRAGRRDGLMSAALIEQLTGLTPARLDHLSAGELTRTAGQMDQSTYLTVDVVRALLMTPQSQPQGPERDGNAASPPPPWPSPDQLQDDLLRIRCCTTSPGEPLVPPESPNR